MEAKVKGVIGEGKALGRRLGYPTANVYGVEGLQAADGVYAVIVRVAGREGEFTGMANLGYRPTVDRAGRRRILEFHLFDFQGDLYGWEVEVTLHRYLRAERVFAGTEELKEQLSRDEMAARGYFERNK
ncbi:MAG: riboflavin kinase [Rikenellaceae bacterium]|nr:riboflavin kinase [Rikenellaceae bacterium]